MFRHKIACEALQHHLPSRDEHKVEPLRCKRLGKGAADAVAGPGDQGGLRQGRCSIRIERTLD
jgi:hypothetical protein